MQLLQFTCLVSNSTILSQNIKVGFGQLSVSKLLVNHIDELVVLDEISGLYAIPIC